MDWKVEFNGRLQRDEIPEIPVYAVREALTNAFAHRCIESGQSVEIAVYRSFIDIYSPGKFPEGLTPEMFITEAIPPVRRNPLLTRTLYYSQDMESFATGLKRIQDACDEAGCRVEYKATEYGFTVRFHRHCGNGWNQYPTDSSDTAPLGEPINAPGTVAAGTHEGKVGTHEGKVGTHDKTEQTNHSAYSSRILQMISENNRISRKEMAKTLSVSERTIQRILNTMPLVRYAGSGNNGHWELVGKE